MPRHLGETYPDAAVSVRVTTLLSALRTELAEEGTEPAGRPATVSYVRGCDVRSQDRSGFAAAVAAAKAAEVVVAVVGDEAGMFGRGTSGEGCDVTSLRLPGAQEDLLLALADTGTPVIAVLVTGRPYALSAVAGRLAGIVQAFFPGEEGGRAIAGVLSGRIVPSGKLPVEMPGPDVALPSSYLRSGLAGPHGGSSVDPSPLFAFGHGLSYTSFFYEDLAVSPDGVPTDGMAEIACTVRNTGSRRGAEVVQLYLSDPVASVARPLRWLAGFIRVPLEPGEARRVRFRVHADQVAFSGRSGRRVIEPGEIRVGIGGASDNLPLTGSFTLYGPERVVAVDRVLHTESSIELPSGVPPRSTQHRWAQLGWNQRLPRLQNASSLWRAKPDQDAQRHGELSLSCPAFSGLANLRFSYAAAFISRYSSMTSCGVRYPTAVSRASSARRRTQPRCSCFRGRCGILLLPAGRCYRPPS